MDIYGSSFNVEFFKSFDMRERERIFYLLDAKELEEMRAIQNRMIARLPQPPGTLANWERKCVESMQYMRQAVDAPFNPLHDVWMRYRDEEDQLAWTAFLDRLLPAALARFQLLMKVPFAERKPFSRSAE